MLIDFWWRHRIGGTLKIWENVEVWYEWGRFWENEHRYLQSRLINSMKYSLSLL